MKKFCLKLLIPLLTLSLSCFLGLTACSVTPSTHSHTYSEEWSFDDEYHWHNATCIHLNEVKDKEKHQLVLTEEVAPTFDRAGYLVYTCKCGYTKTVEGEAQLTHLELIIVHTLFSPYR